MKFVKEDGTELDAVLVLPAHDLDSCMSRYLIVQVNPPEFLAMVETVVLFVYATYDQEVAARGIFEESVLEGEERMLLIDTFDYHPVTIPNSYLTETEETL